MYTTLILNGALKAVFCWYCFVGVVHAIKAPRFFSAIYILVLINIFNKLFIFMLF